MIGSDSAVAGCCRSLTLFAKDYFDGIHESHLFLSGGSDFFLMAKAIEA